MTALLDAKNRLTQILNTRQAQKTMDHQEATQEYRRLVVQISQGQEPHLGNDEITQLLRFLERSESQLQADAERAIQLRALAEVKTRLPELQRARDLASEEYDAWQKATEQIISDREPRRSELAGEYQRASFELTEAERGAQKHVEKEQPPTAFCELLKKIADCRRRSANVARKLKSTVFDTERELADLRKKLAEASANGANDIKAQIAQIERSANWKTIKQLHANWQTRSEAFINCERRIAEFQDDETGLWIGPTEITAEFDGVDFDRLTIPENLGA